MFLMMIMKMMFSRTMIMKMMFSRMILPTISTPASSIAQIPANKVTYRLSKVRYLMVPYLKIKYKPRMTADCRPQ